MGVCPRVWLKSARALSVRPILAALADARVRSLPGPVCWAAASTPVHGRAMRRESDLGRAICRHPGAARRRVRMQPRRLFESATAAGWPARSGDFGAWTRLPICPRALPPLIIPGYPAGLPEQAGVGWRSRNLAG